MTVDERLEALTRNLELLSLESEKHDRQLDRAAKLVTEVTESPKARQDYCELWRCANIGSTATMIGWTN